MKEFIIPPIQHSPAAKWSYFSISYSLFYFLALYAGWEYYSTERVVLAFIAYFVFIGVFLKCLRVSDSDARLPIATLILLCFAIASFHAGANALFGYASFLASFYFRMKLATLYLIANLLAQFLAAVVFNLFEIYFLGPSLSVTLSLFVFGRFSHKDVVYQLKEKQKNDEIEHIAAIAERERIARDMHDLLGHSLSSLALKSELAQKLIDKGQFDKAKDEITQVAQISRQTLSEVRAAVTGLKQTGIKAALESLVEELSQLGIETSLVYDTTQLDAKTESTLIMISKEWITNIMRHSTANEVSVQLEEHAGSVQLNIKDNGSTQSIVPGNGINGIKSRVKELGGHVEIECQHGVEFSATFAI